MSRMGIAGNSGSEELIQMGNCSELLQLKCYPDRIELQMCEELVFLYILRLTARIFKCVGTCVPSGIFFTDAEEYDNSINVIF